MTKYTPITFTKLSEAIAYLEDGGELRSYNGNLISVLDIASLWTDGVRTFHTKPKPAPWYEKLDGTVENGVLCWICDKLDESRCIDAVVGYDGVRYLTSSTYSSSTAWDLATPLPRTEIQKFMDNAPEEV